jgi:DNA-binding Xre family transcriptional regulator
VIICNLNVLMSERRLSIQDVADDTKLSRTTISALVNENGKGIQFDTMDVLCKYLNVTPGELFSYVYIYTDFKFTSEELVSEIDTSRKNSRLIGEAHVFVDDSSFRGTFEMRLKVDYDKKDKVSSIDIRYVQLTEFEKFVMQIPANKGRYIVQHRLSDALKNYVHDTFGIKKPSNVRSIGSLI